MSERLRDLLQPYLVGQQNSKGEHRMRCPVPDHDDSEASASVNWLKSVWHCMGCGNGGSLRGLKKIMQASVNGNGHEPTDANIIYLGDRKNGSAKKETEPGVVERLSEGQVKKYVDFLWDNPRLIAFLTEARGLSEATLRERQIGYDERRQRYTLPVRDETGSLVNIRRYSRTAKPKMKNAAGHGEPPRLFPADQADADVVVLCEGEWDALLTIQNGWAAVTGTHGSTTWVAAWNEWFKGKTVYICYDNDGEGRIGAKRAARALRSHAAKVVIVNLPYEEEKQDLSDWWNDYEGRVGAFDAFVQAAEERDGRVEDQGDPTVVPVQVIGSMDSTTNGRPLSMAVTITGKRDPTYSVPRKVEMECTLDAGPKCKACVMYVEHEGDVEVEIKPRDVSTIIRFLDVSEDKILDQLRKHVGALKCNRLKHTEVENQSVEELFVMSAVDNRSSEAEADYTQRRVYRIGGHDTKTNTQALLVGTTVPSPKDRRNEFLAWDLSESVTSIDEVKVTPELVKRLSIFRPAPGQKPIEKCREIAKDLADNVTGITGRERLHMAIDLVYHSLLHFPLDGKTITRGWLEFIVVGDTRTGKSETALHLSEYYGLGHVIGCEGSTFAGLVGGVKQVRDSWTIQWGEITVNDRRLVVLDEASGLSQDIVSQLSDIRSRGIAQLTKVESQQTRARCRMVWISNPRSGRGFNDEKKYDGIDILSDLIGAPEDIARFDFAMSVNMNDVPIERIHDINRKKAPHVHTAEACHDLILWAWSRKASDVVWEDDAYEGVYKAAEYLGKKYVDTPPLIQRTNVREKIARMAVALAARTFSSDETGEKLVLKLEHVRDAMRFLDELYSYENFGYSRVSERASRNRRIAKGNKVKIKHWLRENERLLEFLLDRRSSFRAQDLEEMAHMDRDEVTYCLGKLSDAKMITKARAQIVLSPELHELLREIERERAA